MNYRLGRVRYVSKCYQFTHGFTRPLYTCSPLTRSVLLGSKTAWVDGCHADSSGQCATRLSRYSHGPNECRANPRASAVMGISAAGTSRRRRGRENAPKWSLREAAWSVGLSTKKGFGPGLKRENLSCIVYRRVIRECDVSHREIQITVTETDTSKRYSDRDYSIQQVLLRTNN